MPDNVVVRLTSTNPNAYTWWLKVHAFSYTMARDVKVHNVLNFKNTGGGSGIGTDQKATDFGKAIEVVTLRGTFHSDEEFYRFRRVFRGDSIAGNAVVETIQFGLDADATKPTFTGRIQRFSASSASYSTDGDPASTVVWEWTLVFNVGTAFSPFGG